MRPYLAHGLSVIPVDHPDETTQSDPSKIGKVPVGTWKEFQERRPTDEQLRRWFGNGHKRNIGLPTGKLSDVVAIDGDSVKGLGWMREHLPLPDMRTKTAKGEHWFFKHPGVQIRNRVRINTGDPAIKIDVRADGGYVVAPGSKHHTGVIYEPIGNWCPIGDLPIFVPEWLETDTAHVSSKSREHRQENLHRASAYLDKTLPAVEGAGGDAHTFTVCCALTRGFDLTDDQAFDLLREWNNRCSPPWTEHDLRTKIQNAREYGEEPIGGRIISFPYTDAGNAERFADLNRDDLRYDHLRGRWLRRDDTSGIWVPDPVDQLTQMAIRMARVRQREALAIQDADLKKASVNLAIKAENHGPIRNMLGLARSVPPLADPGDNWDQDPFLLGVQNGVIDLLTGQFRKPRHL